MNAKRTNPYIPVGHPEFRWTTGADVQATWRKYGWVPPRGEVVPPKQDEGKAPAWVTGGVR